MAVTETDIRAFFDFARERVGNGGADSMQQIFREWLDTREAEDIVEAIQQGEAEIKAGGGKPAEEAFGDIRQKLGWPE